MPKTARAKKPNPSARQLESWRTVMDVSEELGISHQGLRKRLEIGAMRGVHLPTGWLIDPEAVEEETKDNPN